MSFVEKLTRTIVHNQSIWYLGLDPNPELMPAEYWPLYEACFQAQKVPDELREWMCRLVDQTADLVCAYKLGLGFYTALGSAGMDLLKTLMATIPSTVPVILDAKHADLNSSSLLAQTAFHQWKVDAITLSPYLGQDLAARFLTYPDKAILVSSYETNPTAQVIQTVSSEGEPLYANLVQNCLGWASYEQLGLEIGVASPELLAEIRNIAPERLIMARSLWEQAETMQISRVEQVITAGLDSQGRNLILPLSQDVLAAADPAEPIRVLRDETTQLIHQLQHNQSCQMWVSDVCLLNQHPHTDLILQLFDIGCIAFGEYVQASGAVFPYYIDLRRIISSPQVFDAVIAAYAAILEPLEFDRIAGIPYGSLPTASGLALRLSRPLIFPRKEVKAHGARRLVEGNYEPGDMIAVVDDILISGKSVREGAEKLKSCGLNVRDIVVFIDHEGGVFDTLAEHGYQAHAVIKLSEMTEILYSAGRISQSQYHSLSHLSN